MDTGGFASAVMPSPECLPKARQTLFLSLLMSRREQISLPQVAGHGADYELSLRLIYTNTLLQRWRRHTHLRRNTVYDQIGPRRGSDYKLRGSYPAPDTITT